MINDLMYDDDFMSKNFTNMEELVFRHRLCTACCVYVTCLKNSKLHKNIKNCIYFHFYRFRLTLCIIIGDMFFQQKDVCNVSLFA